MASLFIVRAGGNPKVPEVVIDFGGQFVTFRRGYDRGGVFCSVAEVDPEAEGAEKLLARIERLPRYRIHQTDPRPGADARPASRPSPALAVAPRDQTEEELQRDSALHNDWTALDLVGTENGGRSKTAGLTLLELALSPAPSTWEKDQEVAWPWQIPGWRQPGINWRPPKLADKPGWARLTGQDIPDLEEEGNDGDPAGSKLVLDPEEPEVDDEPIEDEGNEGTDDDDSQNGPPEDEGNGAGDSDSLTPDEEAVLASYGTPSERQKAVGMVKELLVENKAGSVSRQRANYFTRKMGIPPLTETTLAAVIRAARLS